MPRKPSGRPIKKYETGYRKLSVGSTNYTTNKSYCVYRYTDIEDGIIKYVGIVRSGKLCDRLQAHEREEEWCKNKPWYIEFFECENQSEVEAFEAHLIALYGTYKYHNTQKATWGLNKYLPDVESWWKPATIPICENFETLKLVFIFRRLLKEHRISEAREILNILE